MVVFTESSNNDQLQQQLEFFKNDLKAFKERKLKLILTTPGKHRVLLPETSDWMDSELYKKKSTTDEFEIILIGLDGGVKSRSNVPLRAEEFYRLIDSMPMRQAELRKNND